VTENKQTLDTRFAEYIQSMTLVHRGDSIVLAVSGGIDSMTMLHLFASMRSQWDLRLAVAHVNHQLRGQESLDDEKFVQDCVQSLDIPLYT
jgi:tRNA(Ile)-lysidine synthase